MPVSTQTPTVWELVLFFGGHVPFFFWPRLGMQVLAPRAGNLCPLQWKCGILATGLLGKSLDRGCQDTRSCLLFLLVPQHLPPHSSLLGFTSPFGDLSELQVGERSWRKPGRTGFCPWAGVERRVEGVCHSLPPSAGIYCQICSGVSFP